MAGYYEYDYGYNAGPRVPARQDYMQYPAGALVDPAAYPARRPLPPAAAVDPYQLARPVALPLPPAVRPIPAPAPRYLDSYAPQVDPGYYGPSQLPPGPALGYYVDDPSRPRTAAFMSRDPIMQPSRAAGGQWIEPAPRPMIVGSAQRRVATDDAGYYPDDVVEYPVRKEKTRQWREVKVTKLEPKPVTSSTTTTSQTGVALPRGYQLAPAQPDYYSDSVIPLQPYAMPMQQPAPAVGYNVMYPYPR